MRDFRGEWEGFKRFERIDCESSGKGVLVIDAILNSGNERMRFLVLRE